MLKLSIRFTNALMEQGPAGCQSSNSADPVLSLHGCNVYTVPTFF